MLLKTKEFADVCKTISLAVNNGAANLELYTKANILYLNVTNREYFVSVSFQLAEQEDFKAVVSAELFLKLIASLTTETFELKIKDNTVIIKAGKSSYKIALIYENDKLASLIPIYLENKTIEMPISLDILKSILNVNSKELLKIKNIDANELQKLYYITEDGCFTFTNGACLNSFKLEQPIKLLLNDRIVKLFKLFETDVHLRFGYDTLNNGTVLSKVIFETENIYLAALVTTDELLLSKVQGPCLTAKNFINENYTNKLVLSVNNLKSAINRLMLFTKNSVEKVNMLSVYCMAKITATELILTDNLNNSEVITIETGSYVDSDYEMSVNLFDIKLILDSCTDEFITLNCGNHRSIVFTRGTISNLIPEGKQD